MLLRGYLHSFNITSLIFLELCTCSSVVTATYCQPRGTGLDPRRRLTFYFYYLTLFSVSFRPITFDNKDIQTYTHPHTQSHTHTHTHTHTDTHSEFWSGLLSLFFSAFFSLFPDLILSPLFSALPHRICMCVYVDGIDASADRRPLYESTSVCLSPCLASQTCNLPKSTTI